MTALLHLAIRSLCSRRSTALLTLSTLAVSVALLLGVLKLRDATRASFENTVSGADLIVGARGGPLNLLLYSVFRVGDATANVSWESYQRIARHPDVAWTIPLSLGDSHRGYRVVGTSTDYFQRYRYAGDKALEFSTGHAFDDLHGVVLGAQVAQELGYVIGHELVLAHGIGKTSFVTHDDSPFRVVGILAPTGTPVDRALHVSLEAIGAIHTYGHDAHEGHDARDDHADLAPTQLTAFLVGMKSKAMVFTMQRAVNEYRAEPLLAIIPGLVLKQLWDLVAIADSALRVIAAFVVAAGLLGMLTAILTSLQERRREMAILRSVGAGPRHIFALWLSEAGLLASAGVLLGVALMYALWAACQPILEHRFGLHLPLRGLSGSDIALLASIALAGLVIGAVPAWRAYRNTLSDGLTLRV